MAEYGQEMVQDDGQYIQDGQNEQAMYGEEVQPEEETREERL